MSQPARQRHEWVAVETQLFDCMALSQAGRYGAQRVVGNVDCDDGRGDDGEEQVEKGVHVGVAEASKADVRGAWQQRQHLFFDILPL